MNDPEFNRSNVTLDMIEVPKGNNFLISGEDKKIIEDNDDSIIKADHFKATKRLNILFTSILFVGLLYLIYRFKQ